MDTYQTKSVSGRNRRVQLSYLKIGNYSEYEKCTYIFACSVRLQNIYEYR